MEKWPIPELDRKCEGGAGVKSCAERKQEDECEMELCPENAMQCERAAFGQRWDSLSNNKKEDWGFPGGTVVKNLPANAEDTGLSPGPGRSHMPRSN